MAGDAFDLVCTCRNLAEVEAVRASLEAHGIPVRVDGIHLQGMLGALPGAAIQPRVMVPAPALGLARRLAADIVGPLEGAEIDDDPGTGSPLRRAADDDETIAPEDDEDDDVPAPRRKAVAVVVLLAAMGLAFGLAHVYVGMTRRGVALLVVAALALVAFLAGQPLGVVVLACVWITDVIGGLIGVIGWNRRVARLTAPVARAVVH